MLYCFRLLDLSVVAGAPTGTCWYWLRRRRGFPGLQCQAFPSKEEKYLVCMTRGVSLTVLLAVPGSLFQPPWHLWYLSVRKESLRTTKQEAQLLSPLIVSGSPERSLLPVLLGLPDIVRRAPIDSGQGRSLVRLAFVAGLGV